MSGGCKKGCAAHLWREMQPALPNLRALCLFSSLKMVNSLLGIMSTHGQGKTASGICPVYPDFDLVHRRPHMEMIALNECFPTGIRMGTAWGPHATCTVRVVHFWGGTVAL